MMEKEKSAKYGVKIYLKLQYQAILKAIEENEVKVAQDLIDNLAFDIEDFIKEGVANIPLLFLCVEKGAEDIALYLLTKGADPNIIYNGGSLQDAAFKAKMSGLYHTLSEVLGFKARRLSAFSETSSMFSNNVAMPPRPPPAEQRAPAGLSGFDSQYLGRVLGPALTDALAECAERRPWDPIEFLSQWLYKFSYNQLEKENKKEEQYQVEVQRVEAQKDHIRNKRHKKEAKHLQKLDEERQKKLEEENRLKEEEELKRKELEELRNKQRETDQLAQPPDLDTVKEDDEPAIQISVPDQEEGADTQESSGGDEEAGSGGTEGGGGEEPEQESQQAESTEQQEE